MTDKRKHYGSSYLYKERWFSFVYQIMTLQDLSPVSVAEIGIGPGVVGSMLTMTYPDCHYVGIDIDQKLSPSVCASVTKLPFASHTFDATFCCQVLEHLPFEQFGVAIAELGRITKRRLVISLPDVSPFFFLRFLGSRRLLPTLWKGFSLPTLLPQQHDFHIHGQHYWEIGKHNFPVGRIIKEMQKHWGGPIQHFRMTERNYWHFFILDRQS